MFKYDVCERCGSINLKEIVSSYEIGSRIYKIVTKKCKDCRYEKVFRESIMPRKFKQEKKENDNVERDA